MIHVTEAKKLISQNVDALPENRISIKDAVGLILAEDVLAPIDVPPFDQSAMDGYAFEFDSWNRLKKLPVLGEIPAGADNAILFSPNHFVRIFTGAALPDGADTVIMQEKTKFTDGLLEITDPDIQKRNAVRTKGSEIKSGTLALSQGSYLSPAAIGFLASMGIIEVPVYPKPRVRIIVTGNELQKPGSVLKPGSIYESNSVALHSALQQLDINSIEIVYTKDHEEEIRISLDNALQNADIVLLTGGVSVGDYDFVPSAAQSCAVKTIFHGIRQKPGKPLFFGIHQKALVFGLPGNPASVLCCFYEYVLPALHRLSYSINDLQTSEIAIAGDYTKKPGLAHFLKAFSDGESVSVLEGQESYKLSSFAKANCLIYVPEEITQYSEGDVVEIHRIMY